ncbi:unnamed protein product [Fraxinus pennsylvanica]|uniref:Uncharacterized protein n=1 Tax=Fraxinus pennsylvanica TaxID=56036 RepID=A0AAD2EDW8_9LAMI|nr:unnamed protein product [Fraxinus pennsylvanica]
MRQRVLLDFRTPQHPSRGTNNWGGASPLLARDIPKESLEQRYLKLNTIRDDDENFHRTTIQDEIFSFRATTIEQEIFSTRKTEAAKYECPPTPRRGGLLLRKLMGKRWYKKWNAPKKRWPNGWC